MSYPPSPYGTPNPSDPQQGGYPQNPQQPQQGGYPQYPQQPQQGGYPQYPQQPQTGGYPQQPQTGGYQQPGNAIPYQQPPGGYGGAPQLQPIKPKRNTLGLILGVVAGVLVVAVVAGSLIYFARKSAQDKVATYSAAKPGPKCDKGDGKWETLGTNRTGTCQSDGFLLTRTGDATKVSEFYFDGKNEAGLAQSYRVAFDGAIQSGDSQAGVGLNLHVQKGGHGQYFIARASGEWTIDSVDASAKSTKLAQGFLTTPTKTFHLDAVVNGAVMIFSINNQVVATVTDATYTTTNAIGFVASDPGKVGVSVLYSNFVYEPKPNATLSFANAAATATATSQSAQPYQAAVPGPGCDKGTGAWAAPTVFGDTETKFTCGASGLAITEPANASGFGGTYFFGPGGILAADYSVSVTIDLTKNVGGCAGLTTRGDEVNGDELFFALCDDGTYGIITSKGDVLASGDVTLKTASELKVTTQGTKYTLAVDGKAIKSITESTFTKNDFVGLTVLGPAKAAGTATFSKFVYTPSK